MLCRDDIPREAILEVTKRNVPPLLKFFVKEEELRTMFERENVRELGNFHSATKAETRADGYFSGLATGEAGNNVSANNDSAILEGDSTDLGANIVGIGLYINGSQFPIVLDLNSGLRAELFALIYNGLNNQLRWKGYPCHVQC